MAKHRFAHRYPEWKPAPPSPTCEVLHGDEMCGKQTIYCYPAMGGGYMALCAQHGEKHKPHVISFAAAKRGENPWPAKSTREVPHAG